MEYMTTYGWAVLVLLVVGAAFWQMGVFEFGSVAAGSMGFGQLRPVEYYCKAGPGAGDTLVLVVLNGAGTEVVGINASSGGVLAYCEPGTADIGKTVRCVLSGADCRAEKVGERYDADVSIGYISSSGKERSSSGSVWGPAE